MRKQPWPAALFSGGVGGSYCILRKGCIGVDSLSPGKHYPEEHKSTLNSLSLMITGSLCCFREKESFISAIAFHFRFLRDGGGRGFSWDCLCWLVGLEKEERRRRRGGRGCCKKPDQVPDSRRNKISRGQKPPLCKKCLESDILMRSAKSLQRKPPVYLILN